MSSNVDATEYKGLKGLVALSGGADSVALLCLLHEGGCNIEALHCNFHLRGEESERDERFVRDLCCRMGIPLHTEHFQTHTYATQKGISTEMAARELRYQWFEEMRQQLKAQYIAVGHHIEDQAETILLNLVRGTGLRGLAGMRRRNGYIVRPLLDMTKAEILDYLTSRGQDYVTDSTNLERDALRNRIRLDVMPLLQSLNPQAVAHIATTAERVAEAIPYYLRGIDQSPELTPATLHERLRGCGFTPAQEQDMLAHISDTSGAVYESHTHRVLRDRRRMVLETKDAIDTPPTLNLVVMEPKDALTFLHTQPLTTEYAYLDADKVQLPLSLRHPRRADRFQPYGMKGGTRLVSDFLTDHKLSLFAKQRQWLACSGEDIVWVCNLRPDHRFRVTAQTRRILILSLS
ncbi:MAG: tRNA lysidine(34) synthetase TilS [Bacteroidaceae bacterium]|nr:tRNA lysidine(34) synthetase TilS [Bacteroidaceae bacterium]